MEKWLLALAGISAALQLPLACVVGRALARSAANVQPDDDELEEDDDDELEEDDDDDFDRDELGDDPEED